MVKKLRPVVAQINELETQYQTLSDQELREKVAAWQKELHAIENHEQLKRRLDELLPEAFAAVKNAARRLTDRKHTFTVCDQPMTWAMVHFDTQLMGGMCLHRAMISEMATGEGKTLVATLPLFLNGLSGRGAHLVTTNDYLARRDAEWMGQVYGFLGLKVGIIQHGQSPEERRQQYAADITYGMNSEFGFDYLRDNGMATSADQQVQRGHYYAIVDEADSILIDEARTPLIISGPATVSTHQFDKFRDRVAELVREQSALCARFCAEAEQLWKDGKKDEFAEKLCMVRWGSPRNKLLLRAMEDPAKRRAIEHTDKQFYTDMLRDRKFALQEEMFFTIDERNHEADLTEKGREYMEPGNPASFIIPDIVTQLSDIDGMRDTSPEEKQQLKTAAQENMTHQVERVHNISQLLRAFCLFERDVQYVVEEGKVIIVDENTGRRMPGRRWSDGLHGAVEAKEGVTVDKETQTLATITIQNYFRLYERLAGMTGTAETEINELADVYNLKVAVIPSHRQNIRKDNNDLIYKTRREKYNAVIAEVAEAHARRQPVLVGTVSVEASEVISRMLKREKIPHTVLNAKNHQSEAEIITAAGQAGAVTISTNMAGRGTDIRLGPGVAELGGLYVLGTERHEARRIDRQLRGRCSRQGDPGLSRFYVSFEDDLMRNFGAAERMTKMMERFGMKEGEALEHPWLNRSVETAQKRVEERNYMIRKRSLDFDNVMNEQRRIIYSWRNQVLHTADVRPFIYEVVDEAIPAQVSTHIAEDPEESRPGELLDWVNTTFPLGLSPENANFDKRNADDISRDLIGMVKKAYELKVKGEEPDMLNYLERHIMLGAIDKLWQEHLYNMDALREGIYLRGHAQKDPLVEYKTEAFELFSNLMGAIKNEILNNLFRSTTNLTAFEQFLHNLPMQLLAPELDGDHAGEVRAEDPYTAAVRSWAEEPAAEQPAPIAPPTTPADLKIDRNAPCPCGSGRKYKACCGK